MHLLWIQKKRMTPLRNIQLIGLACIYTYRPFHKTLPGSRSFINWISVRFYETDCSSLSTPTSMNVGIQIMSPCNNLNMT